MDREQTRDIVKAVSEISRELREINKSLTVLAEDSKRKKIERDNYLIKGMQ